MAVLKNDKISQDCISKFVVYKKRVKKNENITKIYFLQGLEYRKGYIYKYISFNKFDDKETKIGKGYEKNKKITKEYIKKKYCDPSRELLTKKMIKNNDKIKVSHPNTKSYFIHDNGGRPFLVYIGKNEAHIYRKPDENTKYFIDEDELDSSNNTKWAYITKVKTYQFINKFIGKSIKNPMTKFSAGHGPKFNGNSILLELKPKKYVSIGWIIYEFTTEDKILEYYSSVGNNDVPYPVAFGEKTIYFMLDKVYISKDKWPKMTKVMKSDAYQYFYGHEGDDKEYPKNYSKMKDIKLIHDRV
jgi:hypothetical protein